MKRKLLFVKELAEELGISADSVYRAYRTGEITEAQIARIIRFDLGQVLRAMERKTKAMLNKISARRADRELADVLLIPLLVLSSVVCEDF